MSLAYEIQQGDCLSSIAAQFGFHDWRTIYDDPANQEFRKKRPNPNVICPGDILVIPDITNKIEPNCSTNQKHNFVRKSEKTWLRIKLRNGDGTNAVNCRYNLEVEGVPSVSGATDHNGMVIVKIPAKTTSGLLTVWFDDKSPTGRTWRLKIGHLDPVVTSTGIQARLNNLGYVCGSIDGVIGPLTRAAVRSFQEDNGLTVDGIPGPLTQQKLEKLHGS